MYIYSVCYTELTIGIRTTKRALTTAHALSSTFFSKSKITTAPPPPYYRRSGRQRFSLFLLSRRACSRFTNPRVISNENNAVLQSPSLLYRRAVSREFFSLVLLLSSIVYGGEKVIRFRSLGEAYYDMVLILFFFQTRV